MDNDNRIEKPKLKILFADILREMSVIDTEKLGRIYIKHLTHSDIADIDVKNEQYKQEAIDKGAELEEDKLQHLIKMGDWLESQERDIANQELYVKNLHKTKNQVFADRDKEEINKQIKEAEKQITLLKMKRGELIGFTVEQFAAKKINEYYVFNALFKDTGLKERLYDEESFDDLDENQIGDLIEVYNQSSKFFNQTNLQRISLAPFFMNSFHLANDDAYVFWGKPIIKLTFYQTELFGYAKYFKSLLQNAPVKPDDDLYDDPSKLIDFCNSKANLDKVVGEAKGDNVTVFGVTQEELKKKGYTNNNDLAKKAKKLGKTSLSMQEMMP